MNFKVNSKDTIEDLGIVYVLAIDIEDKTLVKIGVTSRSKVDDRVCEILLGIWKKYRIFPRCYVKRFRKTDKIFEKEAILHKWFEEYSYETEYKFGGCTEFFDVPLDNVVEAYEIVIKGKEMINQQWASCKVCGKDKKFVHFNEDGTEMLVCGNKCEIDAKEG